MRRWVAGRLRALRFARLEYQSALYFDDWAERRALFAALDLFDLDDHPVAEAAFYRVQDRLNELNRGRS